MKQKKIGMKWFNFFTQAVPLISILELIAVVISLFNPEYRKENFVTVWSSIFEIMTYIEIVMVICLYFIVRKKYKHTVGYINMLLLFQTITVVYGVATVNTEINSSNYAVMLLTYMTLVFAFCLWYLPNIRYFEKRKWYFENKLQEESSEEYIEQISVEGEQRSNKRAKRIMSCLVIIGATISVISAAVIELKTDYINSLEDKVYELQDKADFLDENVVLIIDGDDKYYYTYDQVMQLSGEETYYYWVCTDVEAESMGYQRWQ